MKGTFNRIAPAAFAEKTGIPLGWMVISHRWMPEKSERRRAHGKWFRLKSAHGTSYRVLRFSANLTGSPPDNTGDLVIDWPAWLELSGYADDVNGPLELEITKASLWQLPQLAASHPDPAMRLSSMLGFVSVVLGVLSIVLAVVLT
ncbi:hypothetical protein [Methyloversatilis discipulorum]|jgi:hypothetical protein|uniref:hypothetical protein n=1 Tax=Methyloversatilis discipulorum TaxID=1119528 RepID=UPI003AF7CA31